MITLMINGSPKPSNSTSRVLLETLELFMNGKSQCQHIHFRKKDSAVSHIEKIKEADTLVIAYPLYVDGVPGHLLNCLKTIEKAHIDKPLYVYGISNCGFYEGQQAAISLDILKNWCVRCGFLWGGGYGLGGGGAVTSMPRLKKSFTPENALTQASRALSQMAEDICQNIKFENVYPSVLVPRFIYQAAAHRNWRQKIKSNGGKVSDLEKRW